VKRIGLFGGSFDPVHIGHLLVAQAAFEELALDRLFFIPAAQSPFKPGRQPAPAVIRLRMLRMALACHPDYEVDSQEVQRGGVSYTIDTIRAYGRRFPHAQLMYLIGADHVSTLPLWREAEELARLVHFVVIPRPGEAVEVPRPFQVTQLNGWPLRLSSSEIRTRVKDLKAIEHLVPYGVEEAIVQNGLYRTGSGT
jgi:nicotinate-nucleotide adenylyltransferase